MGKHYIIGEISSLPGVKRLQKHIPDEALHVQGEDSGRLENYHVTLLYGLEHEADYFPVRKYLHTIPNIELTLGKIFKFEKADCDVIVLSVTSPRCEKIHTYLKENFENSWEYETYTPHITLAYVKRGSCDALIGNDTLNEETVKLRTCAWGHSDGYMIDIPLGKKQKYEVIQD